MKNKSDEDKILLIFAILLFCVSGFVITPLIFAWFMELL